MITWRLNNILLKTKIDEKIKKEIKKYFEINNNETQPYKIHGTQQKQLEEVCSDRDLPQKNKKNFK